MDLLNKFPRTFVTKEADIGILMVEIFMYGLGKGNILVWGLVNVIWYNLKEVLDR